MCKFIGIYVRTYVRMYICLYICMCVCMYVRALRRHHILLLLIEAIKRSGEHLNIFSINTELQPYCMLCLYRTDCSRIGVQVWQCHAGERNLGNQRKGGRKNRIQPMKVMMMMMMMIRRRLKTNISFYHL